MLARYRTAQQSGRSRTAFEVQARRLTANNPVRNQCARLRWFSPVCMSAKTLNEWMSEAWRSFRELQTCRNL
jgi:hypothetical protein